MSRFLEILRLRWASIGIQEIKDANRKIDKFVDAIKEFQPQVVGPSGFLTLAFDSMTVMVEAIKDAGLRDHVKIMIGGGRWTNRCGRIVVPTRMGQMPWPPYPFPGIG